MGRISPPFTDPGWTSGASTGVVRGERNFSLNTPTAWDGMAYWDWQGFASGELGKITLSVESSSPDAMIAIWVSGEPWLVLPYGTGPRFVSGYIPIEIGEVNVLIHNRVAGPLSVTGFSIYEETPALPDPNPPPPIDEALRNIGVVGYRPVGPESPILKPGSRVVSTWQQLNDAMWQTPPGSTIYVRGGTYSGANFWVVLQGTAQQPITIKNYPNEKPVFTCRIAIEQPSKHVIIDGLTFADQLDIEWGAVVLLQYGVENITVQNCEFRNLRCKTGKGLHGLYVNGNDTQPTIRNILIRNNWFHDMNTGWSEACSVAGNTDGVVVELNTVERTGNIGIDILGNYRWEGTPGAPLNQARNIIVRRNLVTDAFSPVANAAGLYCDGARDVVFDRNIALRCQIGIELGCEEPGLPVRRVVATNNLLIDCGRSIGVGSYLPTGGGVDGAKIWNNTVICKNDRPPGNYFVLLEYCTNVEIRNNVVVLDTLTDTIRDWNGTSSNVTSDHNIYWQPGVAPRMPAIEGPGSRWVDPQFRRFARDFSGDFRPADLTSPIVAAGAQGGPNAERDLAGIVRRVPVGKGAYELVDAFAWDGTGPKYPKVWNGTRWRDDAKVWAGTTWVPLGSVR